MVLLQHVVGCLQSKIGLVGCIVSSPRHARAARNPNARVTLTVMHCKCRHILSIAPIERYIMVLLQPVVG